MLDQPSTPLPPLDFIFWDSLNLPDGTYIYI